MLAAKFPAFVTEVDGLLSPHEKVSEEDVVQALAQDYSSYQSTTTHRTRVFERDFGKEQQLNSLCSQVARRREYLQQLTDTLNTLLREDRSELTFSDVSHRLAATREAEDACEAHTLQCEFIRQRTAANTVTAKSRTALLQREVTALAQLLEQAREEYCAISTETTQQETQLKLMQDHIESSRKKREDSRRDRLATLARCHKEVGEEWTCVKIDKGKSMTIQRNIERLQVWLGRQREARKVLRLHIGLEELGSKRLDRLLEKVVTSLGGSTVNEAVERFQAVIAKNKSLQQEAEYKLSLQSSYDLKISVLSAELRVVSETVSKASAKKLKQKLEKSEIQYEDTIRRMKTAEQSFRRTVTIKEINRLTATKAITQLESLYSLLSNLDPTAEGAPYVSAHFDTLGGIARAFLLLEKRLLYIISVICQRNVALKKTPPTIETFMKMLSASHSRRATRREPQLIPKLAAASREEDDLSSSKDSAAQLTASTLRAFRARKSRRKTLKRVVSSPQEFFAARMQMYRDFEGLKSAQGTNRKKKKGQSMCEMLYCARQSEKRLESLTLSMQKEASFQKRKSEHSDFSEQHMSRWQLRTRN